MQATMRVGIKQRGDIGQEDVQMAIEAGTGGLWRICVL